jgi:hypothetical protein
MKQFMIWPILVPAIALFYDESLTAATTNPQHQMRIILCNDDSLVWDESPSRPDFGDILRKMPEETVRVDGTITEEGGTDQYNDDCYDMNNE